MSLPKREDHGRIILAFEIRSEAMSQVAGPRGKNLQYRNPSPLREAEETVRALKKLVRSTLQVSENRADEVADQVPWVRPHGVHSRNQETNHRRPVIRTLLVTETIVLTIICLDWSGNQMLRTKSSEILCQICDKIRVRMTRVRSLMQVSTMKRKHPAKRALLNRMSRNQTKCKEETKKRVQRQ